MRGDGGFDSTKIIGLIVMPPSLSVVILQEADISFRLILIQAARGNIVSCYANLEALLELSFSVITEF